jgi:hypothetical protein
MAYFKLTSLDDLLPRMAHANVDRCHFRFHLHKGEFDVFLFVDVSPYVLAFGAIGENFYFELDVDPRTLETSGVFATEVYYKLCDILGLRGNGERFTPSAFLAHVNEAMIGVAFRAVTPRDLAPHRREVEESEKVWFCGWLDNTVSGKHVTVSNLEKTRRWLGEQAYRRCKERNLSSRWTDDRSKVIEYFLPR